MAWFEKYATAGTSGRVAVQRPWYPPAIESALAAIEAEIGSYATLADYRCRTGSGRPPA